MNQIKKKLNFFFFLDVHLYFSELVVYIEFKSQFWLQF